MLRSFVLACGAAALVCVPAPPAPAAVQQKWNPGKRFIESATPVLEAIQRVTKNGKYGYSDGICMLSAFLLKGQDVTFVRDFRKGESVFVLGGGDSGVKDLDLFVIDDGTNRDVASDTLIDANPVVEFTVPADGRYKIKVKMDDAGPNGSFATVCLLSSRGFSVPTDNLASALARLIVQCEDVNNKTDKRVLFTSGNNQWAVFGAVIRKDADLTINGLNLGNGPRVLVCGGDETTTDIDLYLLDSDGRVLVKDEDDDAIPRVVHNAVGGRSYGFRVKNAKSRGPSLILTAALTIG